MFHDGELTEISGKVPGDIRVKIEIGYLVAEFEETGDYFDIHLQDCVRFLFTPYNGNKTMDFASIENHRPMLVHVASDNPLILDCSAGTLEIEYAHIQIKLPSGRIVSQPEIIDASERYWDTWRKMVSARQKKALV